MTEKIEIITELDFVAAINEFKDCLMAPDETQEQPQSLWFNIDIPKGHRYNHGDRVKVTVEPVPPGESGAADIKRTEPGTLIANLDGVAIINEFKDCLIAQDTTQDPQTTLWFNIDIPKGHGFKKGDRVRVTIEKL